LNPLGGHFAFVIGIGLAVLRTFFLAGFFLAGFFFTAFFLAGFFSVTDLTVAEELFFGVGEGLVAALAGATPNTRARVSNNRSASKTTYPTGKF
jgi:hypothetical protein